MAGSVTLAATATAVALWCAVGLAAYAVASYLALFYLPSADRPAAGAVADAAFVATLPFVLTVAWLAGTSVSG